MNIQRARFLIVSTTLVATAALGQASRPPPADRPLAPSASSSTPAASPTANPTAEPAAKPVDDAGLREAIQSQLLGSGVPTDALRVDVDEGRVTLTGQVPSYRDKERAADAVSRLRGIVAVQNNLTVTTAQLGDASLKSKVVAALGADPATDEYELTIAAENGVVQLSGAVDSWQDKLLASRVAGDVEGVRDVDNQLKVRPPEQRDDAALNQDVERRLRFDARLEDSRVDVRADAGEVTLSGSVDNIYEKTLAIGHAFGAGARSVNAGPLQVERSPPDRPKARATDRASAPPGTASVGPDRSTTRETAREKISGAKDEAIEAAVIAALAVDPRAKREEVRVTVSGGSATLTGRVDNLPAKRAALEHARSIAGVREVNDRIEVRSAGAPADDAALRDSITTALQRERGIEPGEVTVRVNQGRATLSGNVDSNDERLRAVEAATRVSGVVAIDDRLALQRNPNQATTTDEELARAVQRQFLWSPYVDAGDVEVTVKNGAVTLLGDVESGFEKDQATQNALQAGAARVDNRLKVEAASGAP